MIKYNGQDLADIKYNGSSIKRVMKDGIQIWPVDSGVPNTPTGIQLSEYEIVDTLEIPTGITLREVMNIPTGITLREVSSYTYLLDDYPGASAAYSLQKLSSAAVQGIMVRRDSDDQLVDVQLYDDPSKSIDLDSITESGDQTLGDWVGGASAYIFNWYDQSGNGYHASQLTEASQPMIINAGVLEIANNGLTSLISEGDSCAITTQVIPFSTYPELFTVAVCEDFSGTEDGILAESTINLGTELGGFSLYYADTNRLNISTATGFSTAQYAKNNTGLIQLDISLIVPNTAWEDGFMKWINTIELSRSGGLEYPLPKLSNAILNLMGRSDGTFLFTGNVQELIFYPSDQTANRTAIEDNINSRYNIWVVTAEVDAQLIQADNDNVSDTVIEINGVRSSASDTAVANLISRNVTVITR